MNAPDTALEIKGVIVAATAAVSAFVGWTGVLAVIVLPIVMVLDYLTGTAAAKAHGEWASHIAREGAWHKLGEILAVVVSACCDLVLYIVLHTAAADVLGDFKFRAIFLLMVSLWYILTELGSILENCARLGAPIPKALIEGIGRLKHKVDTQEIVPAEDRPEAEQLSPPDADEATQISPPDAGEDETASDD